MNILEDSKAKAAGMLKQLGVDLNMQISECGCVPRVLIVDDN
jgi:hypothetical protein